MSIRNKITLILISVILLSVIVVNFIFSTFFNSYLEKQEDDQINSICNNVISYFENKTARYQSNANDWGHWDDTYYFLSGDNHDYIKLNLPEDTFTNLDISFMILLDNKGKVFFKRYYNFDSGEFTGFTSEFLNDFTEVAASTKLAEDTSAVYRLDGSYYFVSATDITDSLISEQPDGRLLIGRIIDENVVSEISEIAGGTVLSIEDNSASQTSEQDVLKLISKDGQSVDFDCIINNLSGNSPVILTFEKGRSLYLSGRVEFNKFVFINLLLTVAVALLILALLGFYFTKPIMRLTEEVRTIDLKAVKKITVSDRGKDEFSYLRRAINGMLGEIEYEQNKVKDNEEKLYATLLSVGDGVILADRESRVEFMNPVAQYLTGWSQEDALGEKFSEVFSIINEFTRKAVESPIVKVFETESIVELANHTLLISRSGIERSIEDTAAPVRDKQGKVVGCVLVFRDFSEKKEKQKKIEYLSYHDQLTGLYNRHYFEDEMDKLDVHENLPITLIYADLNGLKTINDAFGHDMGDKLIQQAADVLKEHFSSSVIARTGGDEFIILQTHSGGDEAKETADKVKNLLESRQIMGVVISMSFGWDTKISCGQSIWETMKNAEDSMYRKKILESAGKRSAIIGSILNTLHVKSPREAAHSKNVSILCEKIGKAYGMGADDIKELKAAGELHDIGKISVDSRILNKKGPLSASEWVQIKSHPETGYRILCTASELYNIAEYVIAHHERWDGTGYPKGLEGENIKFKARIISVADAYDAMTCERPYRKALSKKEAAEEIKKNSGAQFDPDIARLFVEKVLKETW